MRRIVIAVCNREYLTNISDLFPSFIKDRVEYVFHTTPEAAIVKGALKVNFDFIIEGVLEGKLTDSNITTPWKALIPSRHIAMQRSSKSMMGLKLNAFKGCPSYLAVPTYRHTKGQTRGLTANLTHADRCIIKPENGARGLGHLLFNPKTTPVELLLEIVNEAQTEMEFSELLKERGFTEVELQNGHERSEGESFNQLKNQNFVIQELITGITKQYRVLAYLDAKNTLVWKAYERSVETVSDGFQTLAKPVPYGKVANKEVIAALKKHEGYEHFELVIGSILETESFIASFDLFLTETAWGFLEYSNQFGVIAPGETVADEMVKTALVAKINDVLKSIN